MKPVILVVDDDRAMGELLSDVLGVHAFEVLVSQTGNDALTTVAQRADIALVLLDMILPDTMACRCSSSCSARGLSCRW